MTDETKDTDDLIEEFCEQNDMDYNGVSNHKRVSSQFDVMQEEVGEAEVAFVRWRSSKLQDSLNKERKGDMRRANLTEELADVVITIEILAEMLDIDLEDAIRGKMKYNLTKSSDRDEHGKVTDDTDAEKPDFEEFV